MSAPLERMDGAVDSLVQQLGDALCREEAAKRQSKELLALLKLAVERMEEECENRERDIFDLGCGNCDAGVPAPHSFGCLVRNAIHAAEKR